jgi:phosphatidylinositol dimannoside acyltransferase
MMGPLLRRLDIYGDFWLRLLFAGARVCPWFLEPIMAWTCGTFFFLFLKKARCAIASNLSVIRPGMSRWKYLIDTYRVIMNFGWTLTDLAHVRVGDPVIDWEIQGKEHLDALSHYSTGAVILTAHMGNYDVAAPLFGSCIGRRIHTVRAPERDERTQQYMEKKRVVGPSEWHIVHYNRPGGMLAVELTKLLQEGEFVAIQGDRILFDVSPKPMSFDSKNEWQLPRGPFLLAAIARTPIVPIFIIRIGWRRYRISAGAPFVWTGEPRDKVGAQKAAADWWNRCLQSAVREHWYQWFVFEHAFTSVPST